jgi:hypothetical protein
MVQRNYFTCQMLLVTYRRVVCVTQKSPHTAYRRMQESFAIRIAYFMSYIR